MPTTAQTNTADLTLRERLIIALSLNDATTSTQIVEVVTALAKPASTVPKSEFDALRAAADRMRNALSTLSQVNRAQADMILDVFVERGAAQ